MMNRFARRAGAWVLAAALLSAPAQALTAEQAAGLLEEYYVDDVPASVLEQPTVEAMLAALGDPYTEYLTAEEYQAFLDSMEDTGFVGIGIASQMGEEGLTITAVLADSPALEAGLQAGDIITAVDGQSAAGVEAATVTGWIQGEEGTRVTLACLRDGEAFTVTVERRPITLAATATELLEDHVAYLVCTTFGNDTIEHMREGVTQYSGQADHWIVDLRDNGGGLTQAAVQGVGLFSGPATVGYLRDSAGTVYAYQQEEEAATIEPVIVLSNRNTASASELFARGIADLNCGIVVGGRSYGKGVAQTLLDQSAFPDYFSDGSALKITTNRFYSPTGATTHVVGVIPDLLVPEDLADEVAMLLSASNPGPDTSSCYRLDLGWRWYIDRERAADPDYATAMAALLSAIPATAKLWVGTGGADGWRTTTPEEVAQEVGVTFEDRSFRDTEESPYALAIDLLATYGLLSGSGDGTFQPEGTLTRAQLCALLAQALNCDTASVRESAFSDVSLEAWYGPAVNALAQMGLVSGAGDGTFRPDEPVNHEQFFSIMGRLARYLNLRFDQASQNMPQDATAVAGLLSYSDWARDEVWLLAMSQRGLFGNTINLLWDDASDIEPQVVTTREEAAALLYQVLSYTDIIPS